MYTVHMLIPDLVTLSILPSTCPLVARCTLGINQVAIKMKRIVKGFATDLIHTMYIMSPTATGLPIAVQ